MPTDIFAKNGSKIVTGSDTGDWVAVIAGNNEDLVLTTLTARAGDDFDGLTVPNGQAVYGPFVSIEVSSGTAICVNRELP